MILRCCDGDILLGAAPPEKLSSFASMVLPLQTARLKPMRLTTRHSNDRLVLSALWERATQDGSAAASRAARAGRSEARRVGKECVSTCRSRGSPAPQKKKLTPST